MERFISYLLNICSVVIGGLPCRAIPMRQPHRHRTDVDVMTPHRHPVDVNVMMRCDVDVTVKPLTRMDGAVVCAESLGSAGEKANQRGGRSDFIPAVDRQTPGPSLWTRTYGSVGPMAPAAVPGENALRTLRFARFAVADSLFELAQI